MSNKLIDNKNLVNEWDFEKNKKIGLDCNAISSNSREKAWWICPKGHSYFSRIESRTRGTGCPYCKNLKLLIGYNDLKTKFPQIVNIWDYNQNTINPEDIIFCSTMEYNFICEKCHNSYKRKIRDVYNGSRCIYCSGRNILTGVNDFASNYPKLLEEWNWEKNKNIDPYKISMKSTKKVWWTGKCEHVYNTSIYSRTIMKTNCPICSQERHSSVSEKAVLFYLKLYNPSLEILENYKDEHINLELDIYIPKLKIAIEYDGERWHRNINKDLKKDIMCMKNNITLYRFREKGCPYYESNSIKINIENTKNSGKSKAISELLDLLNINHNKINIDDDLDNILNMISFMQKEESLEKLYPELSKEWHPIKNGNLKPIHTKVHSNKKVWWIGKCGHEWQATVNDRIDGDNCPYCSGHRVLKGFNDLKTKRPDIANEWNNDKNLIKPDEVTEFSAKKIWWIGKCGHEWQATVTHRTKDNRGCPYCSGQKVLKGFNDFETLNPNLASEWNYNKNIKKPFEFTVHSGQKVWWICKKCGFEWQATIDKRSIGRGCPNCYKLSRKRDKNVLEKI